MGNETEDEIGEILSEADDRFRRGHYGAGFDYWDLKVDFIKERITRQFVLNKISDAIFKEFGELPTKFANAYVVPLRNQPQSELLFPWLHAANVKIVEEELKNAIETMTSNCSEFCKSEREYGQYLTQLKEKAAVIRRQNEAAINNLVKRPASDIHTSASALISQRHSRTDGSSNAGPSIFISHSSSDADLAAALVDLLRSALNLGAEQIRCTSVDGYRLPGGTHTETQLRDEVLSAEVFIGLMTPSSLLSTYVLFELGARWGAERHLLPLLAGLEANSLRGPLAAISALSLQSESQVHQLIEELAAKFKRHVQSVSAYIGKVGNISRIAAAKCP